MIDAYTTPATPRAAMKRLVLAAFLIFGLTTPAGAGFDEGMAAYQRGDYAAALREWLPLAQQGDAAAQHNLGAMYDNGEGVALDDAEAIKWYRMAAEQGYVEAQASLGFMYSIGEGVPEDDAEAVKWYRMVAEQGDAVAQYMLGVKIGR